MKSSYAFFNHHDENNTLYILFSDEKITSYKTSFDVDILYHNDNVVGYRIVNFIRYAKIKYSGIIFYPNKILIDVVNSILINSKVEELEYKKESGYVIKKNGYNLGVYALPGTFLRDETVSNGKYCTYYDLYIENETPNELIDIDDMSLENKDFFWNKEF